jgi:hypothetical protein
MKAGEVQLPAIYSLHLFSGPCEFSSGVKFPA